MFTEMDPGRRINRLADLEGVKRMMLPRVSAEFANVG